MPTDGELTYYEAIGEEAMQHAFNKPFSEEFCGLRFIQVGTIFATLPPPPVRILHCGCGTGWLTCMLSRRGHDCVGIDVAPQAIELAKEQALIRGEDCEFFLQDIETLNFENEFDVVLFFDSLHHCLDEEVAIQNAYRALKPGGSLIASEPGKGHAKKSVEVVRRWGVTEKDMPVSHIARLGKKAGFQKIKIHPSLEKASKFCFNKPPFNKPWLRKLCSWWVVDWFMLSVILFLIRAKLDAGLIVMRK